MEDKKPKCADCVFFEEYSESVGHCKRYPPTLYSCGEDNGADVQFPMLNKTEWCGEFKPVRKAQAPRQQPMVWKDD